MSEELQRLYSADNLELPKKIREDMRTLTDIDQSHEAFINDLIEHANDLSYVCVAVQNKFPEVRQKIMETRQAKDEFKKKVEERKIELAARQELVNEIREQLSKESKQEGEQEVSEERKKEDNDEIPFSFNL